METDVSHKVESKKNEDISAEGKSREVEQWLRRGLSQVKN